MCDVAADNRSISVMTGVMPNVNNDTALTTIVYMHVMCACDVWPYLQPINPPIGSPGECTTHKNLHSLHSLTTDACPHLFVQPERERERSQRIRPAFAYNSQTNINTYDTRVTRSERTRKMHRNATRVIVFIEKNLILSVQWVYQPAYILSVCVKMLNTCA